MVGVGDIDECSGKGRAWRRGYPEHPLPRVEIDPPERQGVPE